MNLRFYCTVKGGVSDSDSDDKVAYKQVTMKVNMIGYTEATFNHNTRAALRSSLATVSVDSFVT
jgi:hypothetical protein